MGVNRLKLDQREDLIKSSHKGKMDRQHCFNMTRLCISSRKILRGIFILIDSCFIGFWLGLLKREILHSIDEYYNSQTQMYHTEDYNRQGLWVWEREAINTYFQRCKRLLVGGVGGGREALALSQLGYDIEGFECNPSLVEVANSLLNKEGFLPNIKIVPRDQCSESVNVYDGIVVGWGVYMLIKGRSRRINFLKQLRLQTRDQAPILLSFYPRSGKERRFRFIAAIGNMFGFLLRKDSLQLGDTLGPNFMHYFTEEEIAAELYEGGFTLKCYSTAHYGHAVGIAD